jgi:hypothetical protein
VISDGVRDFNFAFNKEFYTNTRPGTRHISDIRLQGGHNNNKMEMLNCEVRDREKVIILRLSFSLNLDLFAGPVSIV